MTELFPGFTEQRLATSTAEIFARVGGEGPPLLLLHGFPETHACWHRVVPRLTQRFTLVLPDLPGYGASRVTAAGDAPFAKRGMAASLLEAMQGLGFPRFSLAGHDRGARVAYRLALDHPAAVERLAVLDVIPTLEMWERADKAFGLAVWHWFFLALTNGLPERQIAADPDGFLDAILAAWVAKPGALAPEAVTAYRAAFRRPEVIAAACADYRMGATVDPEHDAEDRAAGRRIEAPLLALWAEQSTDGRPYDPLEVWRRWAGQVEGRRLDCGHFLPEERPEEVAAELLAFFAPKRGPA